MSRGKEEEIMSKVVTCDETWIRQWDPESKQESLQWKFKDEKPPRKFKVRPSAGKLMATVFWDIEGILMIDYLPKRTTMNAEYYSNLLRQLRDAIKEKRRGKLSKGTLMLHDNAPVHTARTTQLVMKELGFGTIDHPPYSPDLAPCDYFLFRNLKKDLRGRKFSTDDEMKAAVTDFFDDKPKDFFFMG
ncbi:histone-lysine N-methyltransferase SETMAR-like [Cydia fagiglandana]|uniref:histone-lysine N-methyltransferase SETMAR-like n=1 Tax=Cydia fagiglandana TaxID=1458189 RepID=UPI002FEE03AA